MTKNLFVLIQILLISVNALGAKNEYYIVANTLCINKFSHSVENDLVFIDSMISTNKTQINSIYVGFDMKNKVGFEAIEELFFKILEYDIPIQNLTMKGFGYKNLPLAITRFVTLKTIDISGGHVLYTFPKEMQNLINLETLDISNCNFSNKDLYDLFENLPTSLDFFRLNSSGHFNEIPSNICKFDQLRYVNFCDNNISKFDTCIYSMPNVSFFMLGTTNKSNGKSVTSLELINKVKMGFINNNKSNVWVN